MSRRTLVIVVLVFLLPVALFVTFKTLKMEGDISIGDTLSKYGFIELNPPSKLVPPGTWVMVLKIDPLHLQIICTPEG